MLHAHTQEAECVQLWLHSSSNERRCFRRWWQLHHLRSIQLRYSQNATAIRFFSSPCWACASSYWIGRCRTGVLLPTLMTHLNNTVCSAQSVWGRCAPLPPKGGVDQLLLVRPRRHCAPDLLARRCVAHRLKPCASGRRVDHTGHARADTPTRAWWRGPGIVLTQITVDSNRIACEPPLLALVRRVCGCLPLSDHATRSRRATPHRRRASRTCTKQDGSQ